MPKQEAMTMVLDVLKQDPLAGIVLAEILGPPVGLDSRPVKPWES